MAIINKWITQSHCTRIGCNEEEYECNDGTCIPTEAVCDSHKDCSTGEDEDPHTCMATTPEVDSETDPIDGDFTTEFEPEPPTDDENEQGACK